jgi:hypothetical protein
MAMYQAMLGEVEFFKGTTVQSMVVEEYDEGFGPESAVSKIDQPISFEIPAQDEIYRDLNNSYMIIKLKVTKADGSKLTAGTDAVAPVNMLLAALFKSVEVKFNGHIVSHANSLYAYRAFMENLLTHEERVLKTRGVAEGYCEDEVKTMNAIVFSGAPNSGFVERNKWISGEGMVLTLVGRPHADVFHQELLIPDNVTISLKFSPSSTKFAFMAADNNTFKFEPVDQRLYVRSKRIAHDVVMSHREMSKLEGYQIPYTRVVMNMHAVSGSSKEIGSIVPGDNAPSRVILGLVSTDALSGKYTENPFNFGNNGLTSLQVSVGGDAFPREELQMDYAIGDYEHAYFYTLGALGMETGNRALGVTPYEWATGYNLYAFKIKPGPIELARGVPTKGACKVKMSFSSAVTGLQLLVYAEVPSTIVISDTGRVTLIE